MPDHFILRNKYFNIVWEIDSEGKEPKKKIQLPFNQPLKITTKKSTGEKKKI